MKMKRLYNWVEQWGDTPHIRPVLFGLALIDSAILHMPLTAILVPLCLGQPRKAIQYASICTVGSVLGGTLGYGLGMALQSYGTEMIERVLHDPTLLERIHEFFGRWGTWGVFAAATTPLPYKLFSIASGFFGLNLSDFLLASVVGRTLHFFLIGGAMSYAGEHFKGRVEESMKWVVVGVVAFLVTVGYVGYKTL